MKLRIAFWSGVLGSLAFLLPVSLRAAVQVDQLPALTLDTIGVSTFFQPTIWRDGEDYRRAEQVIQQTAALPLTRVEQDIFKNLLMTDVAGQFPEKIKTGSFLYARLEALLRRGLFEEVLMLVDQVPETQMTDPIKRYRAEALFGLNRVGEACSESLLGGYSSEEALFIRSVCAQENGTDAEASLAFDVYREGASAQSFQWGTATGDVYYRQLDKKLPEGVKQDSWSVWELPLIAKVLADDIWNYPMSRQILRTVALHANIQPEIRIQAAEKALLSHEDWQRILTPDFVKIIQGQKISKTQKDLEARAGKRALQRIQWYLQAKETTQRSVRDKFVRQFVQSASQDHVLFALAPMAMDLVYLIEPEEAYADMAAELFQISAYQFEVSTAMRWYQVLRDKNEVSALRYAAVVNTMGGGMPETIDPLIKWCLNQKNCAEVLDGFPYYFPASAEQVAVLPNGLSKGYPAFATAAVQQELETKTVGLGVLYALQMLASSIETERPLIQVIGTVLPKGVVDSLLMERLLGVHKTI